MAPKNAGSVKVVPNPNPKNFVTLISAQLQTTYWLVKGLGLGCRILSTLLQIISLNFSQSILHDGHGLAPITAWLHACTAGHIACSSPQIGYSLKSRILLVCVK